MEKYGVNKKSSKDVIAAQEEKERLARQRKKEQEYTKSLERNQHKE